MYTAGTEFICDAARGGVRVSFLKLDIHSVIVLLSIGNLAALVMLLSYRRGNLPKQPYRRFAAGKLLQAVAWLLLSFRGNIPDLISAYIGNALLIAGFAFETTALATFDRRSRRLEAVFTTIAAAGIVAFCVFGTTPRLWVVLASLATGLLYGAVSFVLLSAPRRSALRISIGFFSGLFCLFLFLRSAAPFFIPGEFILMSQNTLQTITFIFPYLSMLAVGIGFLLMLKERDDMLLFESEEKYRTLVEKADEAIVIIQDRKFVFVNTRLSALLEVPAEELVGLPFAGFIHPEDLPMVAENYEKRISGREAWEGYDFRAVGRGGRVTWFYISSTVIQWSGRPATLSLLTDITARKQAEEKVRSLLAEKEILLKEVHHRIKNNMTSMESLISIQSNSAKNPEASAILRDALSRLKSMRVLYENLMVTDTFRAIPMRAYLSQLIEAIMAVFPNSEDVAIETSIDEFTINSRIAFPLGIIVNELITNAMKYAFGQGARGDLRISVVKDAGHVTLSIQDNGPGIPGREEGGEPKGLGIMLVTMLSEQIGGKFSMRNSNGALCVVEFDV